MKCITDQECRAWCRNTLQFISQGSESEVPRIIWSARLKMNTDVSALIALARNAVELTGFHGGLIWIHEWGVRPHDMNLFVAIRNQLGETRDIFDAPGHLFLESETPESVSIFTLCLAFLWDVVFVNSSGTAVLAFSHDEVCEVVADTESNLTRLLDLLSGHGFTEYNRGHSCPTLIGRCFS